MTRRGVVVSRLYKVMFGKEENMVVKNLLVIQKRNSRFYSIFLYVPSL